MLNQLIVSLDWSQIELVLVGEFSGDPEFAKAYGQLPYGDLHITAAASLLSAIYETEVTEEMFKALKFMADDLVEPYGFPLLDGSGKRLTPKEAYAYNRSTPGGKGANFGYWYSGSLSSVAESRGLSVDMMWKLTEAYRNKFAVGEAWRLALIEEGKENGFITLPDGHRRVKYEATQRWLNDMMHKFSVYEDPGVLNFARLACKKIQSRAARQLVNAMIQGSNATIAKRSINKIIKEVKKDFRFLIPIHDENVWSVHANDVVEFIKASKAIMNNHPDIIKNLKMNCTASVGRTFEVYHPVTAPYGQIELDEAPDLPFLRKGQICTDDEIEAVVDYLCRDR